MNHKTCILAPILLVLTTGVSRANEQEAAFVAICLEGEESAFDPKSCPCIYKALSPDFAPEQLTRIAGLFVGNLSEAIFALEASADPQDKDILARIDLVERRVKGCAS